jgi:FAD/FMN-containing dehydrogenase
MTVHHREKVRRIADALRRHRGGPVSLRKRAVSHQVPKAGDAKYNDARLDVSDLNEIVSIDPVARTCTAESGVTFVDLVAATMARGLIPIIVPELKTITVGGAVAGCSIESMSFRYGGFHDTCVEYEIITGNGDVIVCTPDGDNRLMFEMMHGTFGTLGVLSLLKFRLIPAKPFVKIVYERYDRLDDYLASVRRHFERQDVDFMDGMIHSPRSFVLCTAWLVDQAPYTNKYDWMKVYYESTRERAEDYLRTPDYLFRYDRGVTNVHPKSSIGRFLLGRFLGSSELLRMAERLRAFLPRTRPGVTLDVFIPFSKVDAFLAWYEEELRHFPLWFVPYRRIRDYEWLSEDFYRGNQDSLFLDLAIYGMKQDGDKNYYKIIEDKLLELGGMKTLISHNFYSEDDFWKIWNRDNYAKAKAIGDPNNVFRDLYTKTCVAAQGVRL